MRRTHRRIDVQTAWMLKDIDLPCRLPVPKPKRMPDVALVRRQEPPPKG